MPFTSSLRATRAWLVANSGFPASCGSPMACARRSNILSLVQAIATHWPDAVR